MAGLVSRWANDDNLVKQAESQDGKTTPTKSLSVATKTESNPQPVSRPTSRKGNTKSSNVPLPQPGSRPSPKSEPITPFRTKKNHSSHRDTHSSKQNHSDHRRSHKNDVSELSADAQDFARRLGLTSGKTEPTKSSAPQKTSKEDLDKLIEEFKLKRDMDWANDDW